MIDAKDLRRCMNILAELHASSRSNNDKQLILELGYIIKQELDVSIKDFDIFIFNGEFW